MRLFIFLLIILLPIQLYCDILKLQGKKLEFYVDDRFGGFYAINTMPPNEKLRTLLFKEDPPTSYITIIINGKAYKLNEKAVKILEPYNFIGNSIKSLFEIENIKVGISFTITNIQSDEFNSIIIRINFKNNGNQDIYCGARFLFDTCYGEDINRVYLYLSSGELVDYDRFFVKGNIPNFVFSGEYNQDERLFGEGIYIYPYANEIKPDSMIIGSWKKLNNSDLSYKVDSRDKFRENIFSNPDAAVAIYFTDIFLHKDEEISIGTVISKNNIKIGRLFEPIPSKINVLKEENIEQKTQSIKVIESKLLEAQLDLILKLNSLIEKIELILTNKTISQQNILQTNNSQIQQFSQLEIKSNTNFISNIQQNLINNNTSNKFTNDIEKYYQELLRKQEEEYKKIIDSYKSKLDDKEKSKEKNSKIREIDELITNLDEKINFLEKLIELKSGLENLPKEEIESLLKLIEDYENKINK